VEEFNLESIIKKPTENQSVQFSGAIFLTYTLNLCFFEQVIQPALEVVGCQNILIISDPYGYNEALANGFKSVKNAGTRYVCAFIPRKSYYVQHAKMLMLVGENVGRLLVGSGNLTLPGYSKNLEIFTYFDYDRQNNILGSQFAFYACNNLLKSIIDNEITCPNAKNQYEAILRKSAWVNSESNHPPDIHIWHNYEISLWDQLVSWRSGSQFRGLPLQSLQVFSPYYDSDVKMLKKFTNFFIPDEITLRISSENSNLNGPGLIDKWPDGFPLPNVFAIKDKNENQSDRLLHGKVIVGIEEEGSWCLSGSANMTAAAFENRWSSGSNLELVTFSYSTNQHEFDYLSERSFDIQKLILEDVLPPKITISDLVKFSLTGNITITHLEYHDGRIFGHIDNFPDSTTDDIYLVLVRTQEKVALSIDEKFNFIVAYPNDFLTSEAAYIQIGELQSLPRWIDFPELIQKYGVRSYHQRIKTSLDTVTGTEGLFYELMKFFEKPGKDLDESELYTKNIPGKRKPGINLDSQTDEEVEAAPGPENFIVPERDGFGSLIIDRYTQIPYDRHIHSLQDLLSIILLRLTMPTPSDTIDVIEPPDRIPTAEDVTERERQNACQRISNYLISYCSRYSRRVCQSEFLNNFYPKQIISNHFTLCRVLLEFNTHLDEFSHSDFVKCFWMVWSPLVWPELIGYESQSTVEFFSKLGFVDNLLKAWEEVKLSSIFKIMITESFGMPIPWSQGLHQPEVVKNLLTIRDLIQKFETYLGDFEEINIEPDMLGLSQYSIDKNVFKAIKAYLPPVLERIFPIQEWYLCYKNGTEASKESFEKIVQNHLEIEFQEFRINPKDLLEVDTNPDDEGLVYCTRCGASLLVPTLQKIKNGKIALCDVNKDAWLYKKFETPSQII